MTLLEKIYKVREKKANNESLTPQTIQEGEVAVAWIEGKIDSTEAAAALGSKHTSAMAQKAGTLLRILATNGYIAITWIPAPSDDVCLPEGSIE